MVENLFWNFENVLVMGIFYIIVMLEVVILFVVMCYIFYIYYCNFGIVVVLVFCWVDRCVLNKLGKILGVKKFVIEDNYDLLLWKDFKRFLFMKKDFEICLGNGISKIFF